jgi:Holliday junction DNA helicase RuvA
MYYYIRGELVLIEPSFCVIDAGGVGYRLTVSARTAEGLPRDPSARRNVTLYTHYAVREDGAELFGFLTLEELNVFRLLISVSGVGPKAAMSVLSFMSPEKLALAVSSDDRKSIAKAPNIGPKTAARIILELKDKLRAESQTEADDGPSADTGSEPSGGNRQAAVEAMMVLGFSRAASAEALKGIDTEGAELEDVIREALKKLMK